MTREDTSAPGARSWEGGELFALHHACPRKVGWNNVFLYLSSFISFFVYFAACLLPNTSRQQQNKGSRNYTERSIKKPHAKIKREKMGPRAVVKSATPTPQADGFLLCALRAASRRPKKCSLARNWAGGFLPDALVL